MRLRTQAMLSVLLFGVLLVTVSAVMVLTGRQIERVTRQQQFAAAVAQGAGELGYLANDYLIYGESQQLARWQSRFASFSDQMAGLHAETLEQQMLVRNLQSDVQRLKEVFDSIVAAPASSFGGVGSPAAPAFLQASWGRIAVQSQSVVSDASRLASILDDQADSLRRTYTIIASALTGLFLAYLLTNYIMVQRRMLKSMAILQSGAAAIGSGNLSLKIEDTARDEIGDLSRSFNKMAADLRDVTASRTDLEREITERKKVEEELRQRTLELEASNKELEAFAYSVSHDLRAPLRSVEGFSAILVGDYGEKLDEQGKQYLKWVRESARLMSQLIDDLLKLSRVTRSDIFRETVDLSALARNIAAEMQQSEPARRVELAITPGLTAFGDVNLLRLALENLLGNAWKFTGKVAAASIEVGKVERDGKTVFFVRDNGVGFDPKYADKLFAPFQRLHKASEFPGTGIGLATVQRIVRRHGGEIWAESAVDKGATFYFSLS